jgi:hypothetical protein
VITSFGRFLQFSVEKNWRFLVKLLWFLVHKWMYVVWVKKYQYYWKKTLNIIGKTFKCYWGDYLPSL